MLLSSLPLKTKKSTIYYRSEYLVIHLYEEDKLALAEWHGFPTGEDLKKAFLTCLNLMQQKRLNYWIADKRKMKVIKKEDQHWIIKEFSPQLAKTALEKMAVIKSEDIFNQMAIESIFTKAHQHLVFEYQYFNDEKTAINWLNA